MATVGDVSVAADAERIIGEAVAGLGRLHVLVNNAGIQPVDWYFRVEDTPEEVWDRIVGVNLKGTFLMSKYAMPAIRASGGGAVVNMASVQGLQSMPRVPSYAASKGGVLSLTRNMALDYAREGIRVNAICPGTIDSEMVRTAARTEGGDIEANLRRYGAFHPIGRLGCRPTSPRPSCSSRAIAPRSSPASTCPSTAASWPRARGRRARAPRSERAGA